MKFPWEQIQDSIESFERSIERLKEQLKDPEWQRKANLVWEIDKDLNLHFTKEYFWTTSDDESIRVYFWKAIPVDSFNDFFDYLEEVFEEHNFHLSMDPVDTYGNESRYIFTTPNNPMRIPVIIASGVCKQVSTGRMVPETKRDCGFLEDV
jgi:regulatory protein YycH of two-component signal transduction system YycFG